LAGKKKGKEEKQFGKKGGLGMQEGTDVGAEEKPSGEVRLKTPLTVQKKGKRGASGGYRGESAPKGNAKWSGAPSSHAPGK